MFNPILHYEYSLPSIEEGLLLHLDASKTQSYPTTGTTWFDLSGNHNNATIFNTPNFSLDGDGSIIFDGTNQFASANTNIESSGLTFIVWCKIITPKVGGSLISSGTDSTLRNFLQLGNGVMPYQYMNAFVGYPPSLNTWLMLVGAQDGTTEYLYVNGGLANSANIYSGPMGKTINIGKRLDGIYLNCQIAIAKVYDYKITDLEIQNQFNETRSRFGI